MQRQTASGRSRSIVVAAVVVVPLALGGLAGCGGGDGGDDDVSGEPQCAADESVGPDSAIPVVPGDMIDGYLCPREDEDWYVVDIPSGFAIDGGVPDGGTMQGGGMPRVELVSGDATMVMEIRMRCGAALACGDSTARELLEWSFVDDQGSVDGGTAGYTTRDVPWPERVYIKVSRKGGPASCEDYTLTITR